MPNERIVYAHEPNPEKGFRILATGEFDAEMVAVLQAFAEFQAKVVPKKRAPEGKDGAPESAA